MNNELSKRKYKDANPIDTIHKIRKIFNQMNIMPTEIDWKNSAQGYFSLRLSIPDTNLGTNGKGSTYEYALASAYGEFMERLQNFAQFRLSIDVSERAHKYRGFYYAPDEKKMTMEELIYSNNDWFKTQRTMIDKNIDIEVLLNKWKAVSYEDVPSDYITIPYMNLETKRLSYIPMKMVSKMYMSNGMCAGNTAEEAIVQGISEIFERYVNKEMIQKKITPPTIPNEYLERYPKINNMIKNIEASGNYKVILKDCSLGEGFPVVCVIFIDKDMQSYFVKFGSYPIFEIAVERTLTELLQGQDISKMIGLTPFVYKNKKASSNDNVMSILVNGVGSYPFEFFSEDESYSFTPFKELNIENNKELLKYVLHFIEKQKYEIYIRDVSFLGFPSYHIIIPGLSEIEKIDDIEAIDKYKNYNIVKKSIRNYVSLSKKDKEKLCNILESKEYSLNSSIFQILDILTTHPLPWYYSKIGLFLTAVYLKKSNYNKAYDVFTSWLNKIKNNSAHNNMLPYFRCVQNYIGLKTENKDNEDIIKILSTFYPLPMIKRVLSEFGDSEALFSKYGKIDCFYCEICSLNKVCLYKKTEEIYCTLKDCYFNNPINQNDLKYLL